MYTLVIKDAKTGGLVASTQVEDSVAGSLELDNIGIKNIAMFHMYWNLMLYTKGCKHFKCACEEENGSSYEIIVKSDRN